MAKHWVAILHPNSPNYETWFRILGGYWVPLKSPESIKLAAEPKPVEIYQLDADAVPLWVKARLLDQVAARLDQIAAKLGVAPEALRPIRFPIRASDVIVSRNQRAFDPPIEKKLAEAAHA